MLRCAQVQGGLPATVLDVRAVLQTPTPPPPHRQLQYAQLTLQLPHEQSVRADARAVRAAADRRASGHSDAGRFERRRVARSRRAVAAASSAATTVSGATGRREALRQQRANSPPLAIAPQKQWRAAVDARIFGTLHAAADTFGRQL